MNLKDKIEDIFPLTPLQKGLLFHSLYNPESAVYFEQLNCRLEGNVSFDAVNQAWQTLIDRHSILRTAIITKGQTEPVQVVFRKIVFKVAEEDWRGLSVSAQETRLKQFLEEDRRKGFVLNRPPLMRVTLIHLGEQSWQLVCSHHHLLFDGWSMPLLMREFFLLHLAVCEGVEISLPPVRSYGDFIAWLKQKNPDEGEAFWREYMRGFESPTPLLMVPAKKQRNTGKSEELRLRLSLEETALLLKMARNCSVTLNTVVQGAWAILLNRYSRNEDIVYGITVAGRPPKLPGVEQMIGLFINTLPLRVSVCGEETLDSWLQMLQRQQVQMRHFEHSSLLDIQRWSDVPRQPLFESLLAFENFPVDKSLKAEDFGLTITDASFYETTHYPLTLVVIPGDELLFKLTYNSDRFDAVGVELLLQHLRHLLINMANNAKVPLRSLSLLSASGETPYKSSLDNYPLRIQKKETLAARFTETVSKYPDRIALTFGKESLTYREIDSRSNRIARFLEKQGISPEKRVVICLERSPELIIAMLGVVKAGGVYVPIDPAYPRERIEFTVTDCEAELILTTTSLCSLLPKSAPTICLDAEDAPYLTESTEPLSINALEPERGAYVIYTSGSTGKPKGVLVTQGNVTRLFESTNHWFGFNQTDVWTFFHSFAFDFSVWEIWGALLYGGRLVIVPYGISRDPKSFLKLARDEKVTVLNQTPSAFTQLLVAEETLQWPEPTALRYIIFGGEALNLQSLRPWFERHGEDKTSLVNMYGITETTVHVTYRPISRKDLESTSSSIIGQPIPDLRLYILDPYGNPVPPGVTGEIYVGGAGVARGYLNRPEQNAQRFVCAPFSKDSTARLYRSGDLGRFLPNGDLEYLGRLDHQVKIRGFRIEIGEIEAALSQFPGVQENIVVVHSGDSNEKQLIAYLVCASGTKLTIETLRNHLQQCLPDYMVPSHFVHLDKFPLTPNGKIDRKALPAPEINRENLEVAFVPPETPEEAILAKIWQKVLGVNRVGRFDNYFVLGGDSIRSIRVCSLSEEAGLKLKLEQIFSHPILSDLAAASRTEKQQVATDAINEEPFALLAPGLRERVQDWAVDAYPLAQLQAGMLFHSDYSEGATTYNDLFSFRIRMPFDIKVWQQAYAQMFERHQVLQTAFYLGEFSQPIQAILKEVPAQIVFENLTSLPESEQEAYLQSFIEKERGNRFDWSKAPLLRFYLHRLDQNVVQATFALHHAIMDGWSLAHFIAELTGLYLHLLDGKVPSPPPPPSLQYSKFIALEQEALADENQRTFWQKQLEGIPFTRLPRLPAAVEHEVGRMAKIDIALPGKVYQGLKALSNQLGVPLRTVLLAVHMRLLAFCSGEEEVVTGLVCNGRPEERDGDRVLGLFLNTVPFRLKLPRCSWIDLIRETFRAEQAVMPNRRFPFAEIQRMHDNQPLYENSFNFVHFHVYKGLLELRDVEVIQSQSFDETNIPFSVSWSEEASGGSLLFNITTSIPRALEIADCCVRMCTALVANPEANYAQAEVITPQEKTFTTQHRQSTSSSWQPSEWIYQIFERRAAEAPDLPAVTCQGETWTSSELNQRANQLARFLRDRGIGADKPVGICLERSFEMVCAILAVLKAGGCYVPIDPHYPAARIQSMVQDAKTSILLTRSGLGISPLDSSSTQLVFLDRLTSEIAAQPAENLEIPVLGGHTAYIIFTSGSTGRAKGIAISHQALAHHMAWFMDAFAVNSEDVVLQKTPFSFDASVWEFWAALMTGAKLVMAKPGGHQDTAYLVKTIQDENVTLLQVVPTLLEILLAEPGFSKCSSLRLVFSGGEALKKRVWDDQKTLAIPLVNLYGPAETTIDVAFHSCRESENTDTIPIGEAVPNTCLYILDRDFKPVPIGTPGELFVSGPQLARGYWHAPGLTAERFLPDPFSQEPGSRIYRTGDRARYLPDGKIEFLGRLDQQLKIRGFRIETSEIVAVLENQPWVVRAVTKAFSPADGPTRLVAYVELKEPPENWQEVLRSSVRNALPEYMIPSLFVRLDTFPLLPNGKLDLNSLPEPQEENTAIKRSYVVPRNETENILTKIWADVLRISRVGIEDDFFELGGDSILCLQIIAKARAVGIHFTPRDLFSHPQVAALAADLKNAPLASLNGYSRGGTAVGGEVPLTPVQQWFFEQSLVHLEHWNQAVLLDLKQEFDRDRLKRALVEIAESHEAFRLRFRKTANGWMQHLVDDANVLAFDVVDLTSLRKEELSERLQATASQFQAQLDLESGPLFRAVYFQTDENTPDKLLLIIHHLIVDGVSWRVILQDLAMSCVAMEKGQAVSLSANSASFAQWTAKLNTLTENSHWDRDLAFWKMQQVSNPALPLDFPECLEDNNENSAAQIECNFSKSETVSLLYEFPRTRKARIQEVLLAVLMEVVTDWTGESEMVVALESHGRESDLTELDVFHSVGWFTSLFPFKLDRKTSDLLGNLESVKQQFRKLPHNGFSYGILSRQKQYAAILPKIPDGILFNYLGQFDENFPPEAPFIPSSEGSGVSRDPEGMRPFQLEVTGLIVNGKLNIRFVYSKALHREETIRCLADSFYIRFSALLEESRTQGNSWTPADFPLAALDTEQLAVVAGTSDVEDIYPLAPVQQGMLFHTNYESQSGVYLQQVVGEIEGVLDTAVFQRAWEWCIDRHPSLRASFVLRDLPRPLQRIHRRVNLPFVYKDWSALNANETKRKWKELQETDRQQGFSLETAPLMRLTLVKTEEQKWRFLWTHHHLLLDGWSLPLIFRDVIAFYKAEKQELHPNLQQPPVYRDFIAWLSEQESASAESFWRRELSGLQEATSLWLKSLKPSQEATSDYQTLQRTLSQETFTRLVAFAQKNQVTLNTLVQGAWSILLSRYSGSQQVVFGVTVSGRPPELSGAEEMVGLFINTLPLRVTLDAATPFKHWLQELRDRTSEINQYSFSRLVDIQGWSDVPRGQPLFESIIVYENYPVEESLRQDSGELSVHSVESLERTHYPVTLYALPGEDLTLKIAFQKNVGCDEEREQLIHQLMQILERFAKDEPEFLGDIGLLSKTAERDFVQKAFECKNSTIDATVHELFSQQASLTPDAPAVLWGTNCLTYGELERKSNSVAHALHQLGVKPETLVAVCLERDAGLLVALLGILKAGAAYVPLDPSFPRERLDFMLTDSGAAVIVTENTIASQISETSAKVLLLDEEGITSPQPDTALPSVPGNKHLAYVIYTSGSTGRPKGVQIPHDALVNFLLSFREKPGLSAADTLVAVTTLSFDISILELFLPLITGARLVVADRETVRDGFKLAQLLNQYQATVMQATPATWRLLLGADWKPNSAFRAFCGGEAIPVDLAASLLNCGIELWNVYGPTETTIWSTVNPVKQPDDALSIGRGIANTSVYILDSAGHPVPKGVVGELFIGGAGLAQGYRGRPDLTALAFVPNPFSEDLGERLYRTGDLARFLPNGEIEFLGRLDYQVKIRGYRIELGDIETVLENHPAIAQAIVQSFEDTSGDKRLVAYLVAKSDTEKPTPEALRSYVLEKLPDYMVPSAWVFLDTMPLTPNNKVDRRALPAPCQPSSKEDYTAPRNAIEEALAEIWQELMKVERVGVKDNFFDLGGHSLVAAQIHARMRKVFSIDVSLRELFDALTIEKTAQLLVARETQLGRTKKIAQAFLRMKQMTPEEKARLLQEKRKMV
jgi:amino acid adenylation domain-containing protein/non-ribosomal peptide synthase protein (TIGR01720 family)